MKIFISHAVKDKELSQPLVDLLQLGAGVSKSEIFFSLYPGDIPNGQSFVDKILTELNQSNFVIVLVSGAYLRSQFCLGEVGAAHVRNIAGISGLFTLIIPPIDFSDLGGVLYGSQVGKILEGKAIDELLEKVVSGVTNPPSTVNRNVERDKFLNAIKALIEKLQAEELLNHIKILDLFFDRSMQNHVEYKMKLRIVFRNETGQDIIVNKPKWERLPGGPDVRPRLY